jgi:multimeric flavodoxin WrbA
MLQYYGAGKKRWNMPKRVLIINGSYRERGFTDQMVDLMTIQLELAGVEVQKVTLRCFPIEFCTNCRRCTQSDGEAPGHCLIEDNMNSLVEMIETADGYIFASPTNFDTVTALFKRFLERLVIYGYWPWQAPAAKYRKPVAKLSLCVTSCAAPSLLGRFAFNTLGVLKHAARSVGAKVVDTLMVGRVSEELPADISVSDQRRIKKTTKKLIRKLFTS